MTRRDLIAFELHIANTYRREAAARSKNPALQARLIELAEFSEARAEEFRSGPLFGVSEVVIAGAGGACATGGPKIVESAS